MILREYDIQRLHDEGTKSISAEVMTGYFSIKRYMKLNKLATTGHN